MRKPLLAAVASAALLVTLGTGVAFAGSAGHSDADEARCGERDAINVANCVDLDVSDVLRGDDDAHLLDLDLSSLLGDR